MIRGNSVVMLEVRSEPIPSSNCFCIMARLTLLLFIGTRKNKLKPTKNELERYADNILGRNCHGIGKGSYV